MEISIRSWDIYSRVPSILWITIWMLLPALISANSGADISLPHFTLHPQSVIVKNEAKVVLSCHAEPSHLTDIRWKYNGEYITTSPDLDIEVEGGRLHILSFRHRPKDTSNAGVYQCVANNSLGAVLSQEAHVQRAVIGQFAEDLRDIYINSTAGNVAFIPCSPPDSLPAAITRFELNGATIEPEDAGHVILPSGMQIANVRTVNGGEYRCIAINPVTGQKRTAPNRVYLSVQEPVTNIGMHYVRRPSADPDTPLEVIQGETMTLECVVEGSPVPVVTWEKFGGLLPEGRFSQVLGNLVIREVEFYDAGTYICRAQNGGRAAAEIVKVNVLVPPSLTVAPSHQIVHEGEESAFHCHARGRPRVHLHWVYNGQEVSPGENIDITDSENDTSLVITSTHQSDEGVYQCVARNRLGVVMAAAHLDVRSLGETISDEELETALNEMQDIAPDAAVPAPVLTRRPSNATVMVGMTTRLECGTSELLRSITSIYWLHDGQPLADMADSNTTMTNHKPHLVLAPDGSLEIHNAQPSDGGRYRCVAGTFGGTDVADAFLSVVSRIEDATITSLPALTVVSGEDSSEPTTEAGNPGNSSSASTATDGLDYVGGLEGVQVDPGPRRDRDRGRGRGNRGRDRGRGRKKKNRDRSRGEIPRGDERVDRGESEGMLEWDRGGSVEEEGERGKKKNRNNGEVVTIPPSKPHISKLSDTSVKVEWSHPKQGLSVTFFKVQYKEITDDRSKNRWRTLDDDIPDNRLMHEVTGLKPGSTYRFRVLAVYSNDDNKQGPNSAKFTLEVAPVPQPKKPIIGPRLVEAKPLSVSSIYTGWQYLTDEATSIEGFFLYYKQYGTKGPFSKQTVLGRDARNHLLTGLLPQTQYILKIVSFNAAGESKDSNQVVKETLGYSDSPEIFDPSHPDHINGLPANGPLTTTPPSEVFPNNKLSTQSSSEMLYMVLGIVLGIMMLLLIVSMVMCAWKQRQQRRMMAAIQGRNKFNDPSRVIYSEGSMRKKQQSNGGFMLNGLNGVNGKVVSNGHLPHGSHGPGYQANGGSHVNVTANPMADLESHDDKSLQDLRASLQEMLQASAPPLPLRDLREKDSHSLRGSNYDSDRSNEPSRRPEYSSTSSFKPRFGGRGDHVRPYQPPPEYNSSGSRSHRSYQDYRSSPHLSSRGSHDQLPRSSPDHIPRSHELPYRSHDPYHSHHRSHDLHHNGSLDPYPGSYDSRQGSHDPRHNGSHDPHLNGSHDPRQSESQDRLSEHSQSSSSQVSNKHKRRRRRQPSRDFVMRDQATITDLSSNEDTLETSGQRGSRHASKSPPPAQYGPIDPTHSHHSSYSHKAHRSNSATPTNCVVNGDSYKEERPAYPAKKRTGQRGGSPPSYNELARVHDYSPSDHDDLD